jgi:hypothetical protein
MTHVNSSSTKPSNTLYIIREHKKKYKKEYVMLKKKKQ